MIRFTTHQEPTLEVATATEPREFPRLELRTVTEQCIRLPVDTRGVLGTRPGKQ